jgi:hypothetical protein
MKSKFKKEYKGGKCTHCNKEDILYEAMALQNVVMYMMKNHCCSDCANQIINKRHGKKEEKA